MTLATSQDADALFLGSREVDALARGSTIFYTKPAPVEFMSFYDRDASFDGGTRGGSGFTGRAASFYPGDTQIVIPDDASRYQLKVDDVVLWRCAVVNTGGWSPFPSSFPTNQQYFLGSEFHDLNRAWLAQGSARYGGGDFNPNWMLPFAAAAGGSNAQVIWGIWGMVQNQPRNNAGWSATSGAEIPLVGKVATGTQTHHVEIERILEA